MIGKFITLESSEGAGKGTAKEFIRDCLSRAGHEVVMTREPGGTPFAEKMRQILLHPDTNIEGEEELLLLMAGRVNHQRLVIDPSVAQGKVVVSERFMDSTYVYQHFARGLPRKPIDELVTLLNPRTPDLTILLDLDPRIGLKRVELRGAKDRIESETIEFFDRVRHGYLQLAAEDDKGRWRIIDASKTIPEVRGQLLQVFVDAGLMTHKAVTWIKGKYDVAD